MDNLDSLAEMELSNASRIIAEAAESLRRQAQLQKEKEAQQLALGFDIIEVCGWRSLFLIWICRASRLKRMRSIPISLN